MNFSMLRFHKGKGFIVFLRDGGAVRIKASPAEDDLLIAPVCQGGIGRTWASSQKGLIDNLMLCRNPCSIFGTVHGRSAKFSKVQNARVGEGHPLCVLGGCLG